MKKYLVVLLLFSSFAYAQKANSSMNGMNFHMKENTWKVLDLPQCSIQYPDNWTVDQSGRMNTVFVVFSPIVDSSDKFKENVNLLVQDLGEDKVDLKQYTDLTIGQIKKKLENSTVILSKTMQSDTGEYQKIIYTGDQNVFHLQFEQYYRIIDGKAIVLTFTAEQTTFDSYKDIAERMMDSFVIK